MTRTRVLAAAGAAAFAAASLVAVASPAWAHDGSDHPGCVLLHFQIQQNGNGPDLIHFCI